MTLKIKLYLAAAVAILIAALAHSLWSHFQISRLETRVETQEHAAETKQNYANELEQHSRIYEEKITYLESQLAELGTLARKQDEELKSIETNTRNARGNDERTRRIRTAAATAAEVCRKLADLGHPCD